MIRNNFTEVKPLCYWVQHVLPLVYDDSLSYMELLGKVTKKLNDLIVNNNKLPDFIAELIKDYISSGAIEKVLAEVLADYMLNVKFPPAGLTPATGDGSADDTEAIQGCIDYAFNHGGMAVYFPSGKYLTQPLTLKNKATLFGQDRYSTVLVMKGGATTAMFTGSVDELTLSGLGFDGNMDIQVNNVNLFDITVGSAIITNALLTDGYTLLNAVVNKDLQLDNIIFDHAVEHGVVLSGNGFVQADNLIFNSVSALVGRDFVTIGVNNSIFEKIKLNGATPTGITLNGNFNVVKFWKGEAVNAYVDNGTNNNITVYTESKKEVLTGDVNLNAVNKKEVLTGDKSVTCENSIETVSGDKTVNTDDYALTATGNYTASIEKDFTETVVGNKTLDVIGNINLKTVNNTETLTGNKILTAIDVTDNLNKLTVNSNDLELNINNPISYKEPTKLQTRFDFIPFKHENNVYDVLVKNNNTINLDQYINVLDYNADPTGMNDSYTAFKTAFDTAKNGSYIIVPYGTYNLSLNPDNGIKPITWLIDSQTKFTGIGTGNPNEGKGGFPCPYTNPWLIAYGEYNKSDLNTVPCPEKSGIVAISNELIDPIWDNSHRWYVLNYMGSNTGTSDGDGINQQVQLLNQVINVTGAKAICTEIDLNTFKKVNGFSVGLFLTGGGDVYTDTVAIDIQRNDSVTKWTVGESFKQCNTAISIDGDTVTNGIMVGTIRNQNRAILSGSQFSNGTDTIYVKRFTDENSQGSIFRLATADENTILCSIDTNGWIIPAGVMINNWSVKKPITTVITSEVKNLEGGISISYNIPDGYELLTVTEPHCNGVDAAVSVLNFDANNVNLFVHGSGNGSVSCKCIFV
jgi:hypothetical protein